MIDVVEEKVKKKTKQIAQNPHGLPSTTKKTPPITGSGIVTKSAPNFPSKPDNSK